MARTTRRGFLAAVAAAPLAGAPAPSTVFVVPNFHPASCGWLTTFAKERVYCANSHFDHLDRVRDDPNYAFVLSECNNLIAMMNFRPERTAELKRRIKEGRVELVNAYFLESTINLSGGEALVRLGVEGLRWQQQMFGVRPRFSWNIDVCGTHQQMAQIAAGLGLEALVYCRKNPTGSTLHWAESPDGTRILAISPGHYSELRTVMAANAALTEKEVADVERYVASKRKITPSGAPVLVLAGTGDYALAPTRKENPSAFLKEWKAARPGTEIRFATLGQYLNAVHPQNLDLPVMKGGTEYDYNAFWIECPRVKSWFRRAEHLLAAAELTATGASLREKHAYPSQALYDAWAQLFLNMDRNTLWGSAGGMVFEEAHSWDVRDRFEAIEAASGAAIAEAVRAVLGRGDGVGVVNPLAWERRDPYWIPAGVKPPRGVKAQVEGARILCVPTEPLEAGGMRGERAAVSAPEAAREVPFEPVIRTLHYALRIDPATGDITSLVVLPSGTELLGGPANRIVAEKPEKQQGEPGDHMLARRQRHPVDSTADAAPKITVARGGAATRIEIRGTLLGQPCVRRLYLYDNFPRIDCEVELNDVPDRTVVVAEFPLARPVTQARRGIPYGFAEGVKAGIEPAVRWSQYQLADAGALAIFDRGLSGRELVDRTAVLYLLNATEKYYAYPNAWLSGKGKQELEYALYPHAEDWTKAAVARMGFEFNAPPQVIAGTGDRMRAFWVEVTGHAIVESVRREGQEVEVRLVEARGVDATATLTVHLPFDKAWFTDMTGGNRRRIGDGPKYLVPLRPQQIVTLRFKVGSKVHEPKLVTGWEPLAPESKRASLREYSDAKGHPPRGT